MRNKTDVEKAAARFWKAHRRFVCVERAALRRMTHEQRAEVVAVMNEHEQCWREEVWPAVERMVAFARAASTRDGILIASDINSFAMEQEQMASSFSLRAGDRLVAWFLELIHWRPRSITS